MTVLSFPVLKELYFQTLDRAQAYEILNNLRHKNSSQPLSHPEELHRALISLYQASIYGAEIDIRENIEAVNSILDKLMSNMDNHYIEHIDNLVSIKRENSRLDKMLPSLADNLEKSLKEIVMLINNRCNLNVTNPDNNKIEKVHTCLTCSTSFTSNRKDAKYCSQKCKQIAYRERKNSS